LFFQLVNAGYEKGAMILTSNRGFAEWGKAFGDPIVATALLDRLLHHAVVIQIEGSSYRMREHAALCLKTCGTAPRSIHRRRVAADARRREEIPILNTADHRSLNLNTMGILNAHIR
jgi:hypothetical protein